VRLLIIDWSEKKCCVIQCRDCKPIIFVMLRQYSAFLVNGVLITVLAWLLQYGFFKLMAQDSSLGYAIATALATIITMIINFFIQKKYIFKKYGLFHRYLIADVVNLFLVTILAPIFRLLIAEVFTLEWGDKGGFLMAAFVASIPVFFIKRHWVFSGEGLTKE